MVAYSYFAPHPIYFQQDDDYLRHRMGGVILDNEVSNITEPWTNRDMVLSGVSWMKPRFQWCPKMGVARYPQRLHLVTQPPLAGDTSTSGDQQCVEEAPDSINAQDKNSSTRRKPTASVAGGGNQGFTGKARCSAGNRSSRDTSKDHGGSAWRFVVDMDGCSEAKVMTQGDMLTVEGYGVNNAYHKTVRYVTHLPSNVRHDFLTASLRNGHLTVTQKILSELKGKNGTLPVEVQQQQQQKAPEVEKQQQQE